jgi:transketolase
MPLTDNELQELEKKAYELRCLTVDTVAWAGSGHIGGALSAMDIFVLLYYKYLRINPKDPNWADRDRFILSKGHSGVGHAPVLADRGYFDKELLKTYNHSGSDFGMHLNSAKVPGVDASTGSLGHGISIAVGTALAARVLGKSYRTYCLLGDGECDEGQVWEAAMAASHYKTTDLILFVDRNHFMIDGNTENVMKLEPFAEKWKAFGFIVKQVNGHSFRELAVAIDYALEEKEAPVVIIAETVKGCGVDFIENQVISHYMGLDDEKIRQAKESIRRYYEKRVKGA